MYFILITYKLQCLKIEINNFLIKKEKIVFPKEFQFLICKNPDDFHFILISKNKRKNSRVLRFHQIEKEHGQSRL